jgi:hypothetical protein
MQKCKVYRIPCKEFSGTFYCKTMPWKIDNFFYFKDDININEINFGEIDFFYANWVNTRLYKEFEFIRKEAITEKEKNSIPTFFNQNLYDLSRCDLVYPGKPDPVPCRPEDCIGLERAVVHDSMETLCEKLKSKITGVPIGAHEIMRLRIPGTDKPFDFKNDRI